MHPDTGENYGVLTYIAEIVAELAEMAERTGHDDLGLHLRTAGEAAAQKVRHVVQSARDQV